MQLKLLDGDPYPLGATCTDGGVNFALFSAHAERVELCIFTEDGSHELQRFPLPSVSNQVWHGFLPEAGHGTVYGYRVYGPYEPHLGHRFNPNKLLLDPYARCLLGEFRWDDRHYGYDTSHEDTDLILDTRDNSHFMPKSVVMAVNSFRRPRRNRIPKSETIVYEAHLKGYTRLHPKVKKSLRGTCAGFASDVVLDHIRSLGITSVELLPVQSFISESFLIDRGLSNYWGYNTMAFFVPHQDYLSGADIYEFRHMVDRIHDAGLEVILDVVFNHTAEGGRLGPTLSFRGIDNASYYRLQSEDKRFYINDTGCGNTINITHTRVVQLVMDCLRYWVTTMGVDGFRFDLAPVLGRELQGFDQGSGFFDALQQDPVLAATKFISEPWDIGPGGYQLGNFPPGWSEWNDRYRDTVRRFWRGDNGMLPEFAGRIHGSSDIFEHSGRRPSASINFVTSHDGFSLADLVSFKDKHNEDNGEENRDGHRDNLSENYGIEGPTDDENINALRWRQQKNLLGTLLISQGTPMVLAGDEFGRSQRGNNNAYCQDNEISWLDWEKRPQESLNQTRFLAHLISLRKRFPIFSMDAYVHEALTADDTTIEWFNNHGDLMQTDHWGEHQVQTLGLLLSWHDAEAGNRRQHLYFIFHAGKKGTSFALPKLGDIRQWEILFDTRLPDGIPESSNNLASDEVELVSFSAVMLLAHHRQMTMDMPRPDDKS